MRVPQNGNVADVLAAAFCSVYQCYFTNCPHRLLSAVFCRSNPPPQIYFHNDKTEFVAEHVVRVPRDGNVADVLAELSKRLGADYEGRQLRLLEVYQSKVYKVGVGSGVGGVKCMICWGGGLGCGFWCSTGCLTVLG